MKPHLRMVDVGYVPAIRRARWRYVRFIGEAAAFALLLAVIFIGCAVFE